MPISVRAAIRPARLRASANATHPNTATLSITSNTWRGPKRSSARPSGNCMAAKPKKYAPANKPRSAACRPSSTLNSGANVAVTARSKADRK